MCLVRLLGLVFGLAALFVADAPAQQSETRIALIIANEAYVGGNFQSLPGTQADAAIMRPALERAGFAVTVRRNLTRQQMRDALADFARQLAELGPRGVGFLYYSGHGVGQRGDNFLIPVDARVQALTDLPLAAVPLSEQLEALQFSQAHSIIIVLDACRTSFGRGSRGLAPVPARTDTLIAFSTQPNELAADDGLYARVLAQEISRPGADTITAFARVTASVANATGRAQVPRYDNGLIEPVAFSPASPSTAPPVASQPIAPPTQVAAQSQIGTSDSRVAQALLGDWRIASGHTVCGYWGFHITRLGDQVLRYQMGPGGSTDQVCTIASETGSSISCMNGAILSLDGERAQYVFAGQRCGLRR